jgi:transcriptional regulator with XRE-family HTH domain
MGISIGTGDKFALGAWAKNLRIYLKLSQKEIARLAKVSLEDVDLFEKNRPLATEIKNRIVKELNNIRTHNWDMLANC